MAIRSEQYNLLFIMNPRTGCTALGALMVESMNGVYLPEEDLFKEDGKVLLKKKHSTLPEIMDSGILSPGELDDVFKFTSVRNPYDSLVSLWTKKRYKYAGKNVKDPRSFLKWNTSYSKDLDYVRSHSFPEWIINVIGKRTSPKINLRHIEGVDRILRFENLQEDFDDMLEKLDIERDFTIPMVNKTKNREPEYRSYYTDEARAVVTEKYGKELELLGYEF